MKVVKKNVYYCDHCKKRSLSGGHMKTHEAHCTANAARTCRLCGKDSIAQILADFSDRFTLQEVPIRNNEFDFLPDAEGTQVQIKWTGEPVTLKEIRDKVEDCPTCILAILRIAGFNRYYFQDIIEKFDYKMEKQSYFNEKNENNIDPADYYRY